jgi:hypothetical protein
MPLASPVRDEAAPCYPSSYFEAALVAALSSGSLFLSPVSGH